MRSLWLPLLLLLSTIALFLRGVTSFRTFQPIWNWNMAPTTSARRFSTTREGGLARGSTSPLSSSSPQKRRKQEPPVSVTPDHISNSRNDSKVGVVGGAASHSLVENITFVDLDVPPCELRPSATLTTGQCFHWKALNDGAKEATSTTPTTKTSAWGTHDETEWIGTLRWQGQSVVVWLRETPDSTLYHVLHPSPDKKDPDLNVRTMLQSYFQLSQPLAPLYEEWSAACPRLARISTCIPGVRIVEQDPWECLISFICSSNNNIPRITKMLEALRREYGEPLLSFRGSTLYSFPSLEALKQRATEQELRSKCGMGYRAKYIVETVKILDSLGGEPFLHQLRAVEDDPVHVQTQLLQFCGVGRKVADCVALFSLRQPNAIPVDVHVWNIARRDYDTTERMLESVKSLTPKVYAQVGDLFRNRFGSYSGWAHSLLFVAELPSFRAVLPEELIQEMDKFRKEEKAKKAK